MTHNSPAETGTEAMKIRLRNGAKTEDPALAPGFLIPGVGTMTGREGGERCAKSGKDRADGGI